jgi:amino acid transporter
MMARYFYSWLPLVFVGTAVILTCPWLAVIALIGVVFTVLAALGAFAWAVARGFYALGRAAFGSIPVPSPERVEARQPVVALNAGRVASGGTR